MSGYCKRMFVRCVRKQRYFDTCRKIGETKMKKIMKQVLNSGGKIHFEFNLNRNLRNRKIFIFNGKKSELLRLFDFFLGMNKAIICIYILTVHKDKTQKTETIFFFFWDEKFRTGNNRN